MSKLSPEEKEVLDAFESGQLKRVKNQRQELARHRKAAAATFVRIISARPVTRREAEAYSEAD